MSQEIVEAVREIEREKGIDAGAAARPRSRTRCLPPTRRRPGASRHATVELDDAGDFRVFAIELPEDLERRLLEEARERALDELERIEEETGEKNHTLLSDDDLDVDWSQVPDELMKREDVTPDNFGRIAAQTAKQVILQRIREAEREMMYDEYIDRVGEVVTGIVQQAGDRNNVLVDLGKVEALLPRSEQVDGERYEQGSRIKAVITEVRTGTKGPQVILSRRDPELIKTLFELEVPEIADGLVEIRGVAREPGYRSKIAVESHAQGVDPVGACVGPRGSRVRMVVSELRGEKIDIIPWNPEPARFVAKALSPARVREVYLDDAGKEATVVVPDDQLALAIGKEGMNARLAHRLTGWKIDIVSDTEFAQQEAEAAFGGDGGEEGDFSGRCSAVLSNGKRCPNAALPGSKYCGVPAHQELALHEPDDEANLIVEESEPELEALADMAEPEAVTEDAAEFGNPRAGGVPGRPGRRAGRGRGRDARVGRRRRRSASRTTPTTACRSCTSRPRRREEDGSARRLSPVRTCAGCGRKAPQAELQRFHAARRRARRRAGARPRRLHLPPARLLRARPRASRLQSNAAEHRPRRARPRAALHLRSSMPGGRPIRPRGGGGPGNRKRRVVIDGGTGRPGAGQRQRPGDRPGDRGPKRRARSRRRPARSPSSPASRCATSRRPSASRCRRSSRC